MAVWCDWYYLFSGHFFYFRLKPFFYLPRVLNNWILKRHFKNCHTSSQGFNSVPSGDILMCIILEGHFCRCSLTWASTRRKGLFQGSFWYHKRVWGSGSNNSAMDRCEQKSAVWARRQRPLGNRCSFEGSGLSISLYQRHFVPRCLWTRKILI